MKLNLVNVQSVFYIGEEKCLVVPVLAWHNCSVLCFLFVSATRFSEDKHFFPRFENSVALAGKTSSIKHPYSATLSQVSFLRTRFHLPRHLGNITQNKFSFNISRSLGGDYASNADRERSNDRYFHYAKVRWNAPMSGLGP